MGFLNSCKKDKPPPLIPPATAQCVISGETTTLSGNGGAVGYEFDAKGNLSEVKNDDRNGSAGTNVQIGSNTKTVSGVSRYSGKAVRVIIKYGTSDIFNNVKASRRNAKTPTKMKMTNTAFCKHSPATVSKQLFSREAMS